MTQMKLPGVKFLSGIQQGTGCLFLLVAMTISGLAQATNSLPPLDLSLEEFIKRVVEKNESIQTKILEVEFNRRRLAAEHGTFEPAFFSSATYQVNERENTAEQRNNQSDLNVFREKNYIYEGGIEGLVPSGAKVRLGYTLRDLDNNLKLSSFSSLVRSNEEYQTFFGVNVEQPLLKGAWRSATLAGIRVASLSSDLAYQDYRRQMMVMVSTAVASYWELYLAQEQVRFFNDSVATAAKILTDNRARREAGRGSELDVMEAEAGLALRRSKLGEAEQKLFESVNKVLALASSTILETNRQIRAGDEPRLSGEQFNFLEVWRAARSVNPDYLSQQLKLAQENVRLAYARSQRLPELNLKGSFGVNGLGETPGASWDDIENAGFPSWSIGAELRVPLGGDIRARNELRAAYIRCQEAKVGMQEIETAITSAINTALQKVRSARTSSQSYQTVVEFYRQLLDSALAQLEVGRIESRKLLDIEANLLDARNSAATARVQFQRAVLELELIQGAILKKYHFDLTQTELQTLTAQLARHGRLTDAEYQDFIQQVQRAYHVKALGEHAFDTPAQRAARRALEALRTNWLDTNPPPVRVETPMEDKLRDAVRQKIEELRRQDQPKP